MILVDTSVWIDHLRKGDTRLKGFLEQSKVLTHPMIIGELACGNIRNRTEVLHLLDNLPGAQRASDDEVRYFIDENKLMGRGVGFVDFHILVSVALSPPTLLWTRDKSLKKIALEIGLGFDE